MIFTMEASLPTSFLEYQRAVVQKIEQLEIESQQAKLLLSANAPAPQDRSYTTQATPEKKCKSTWMLWPNYL